MATFTKLEGKKKTSWEYRLVYKDPITGSRKEKSKSGFATKGEAQAACRQFENDLKDGYREENVLLLDYVAWYMETHKKTKLKESTYELLELMVKNHIKPYFQNIKLADLAFKDEFYQAFLDQLADKGYSKSTVEKPHFLLNEIFRFAVKKGKMKKNPAEDVTIKGKPKTKIDEYEFISRENVEIMLQQALKEGFEYYVLFRLLFESGLRKGEACGLTWDDIDLEAGIITINKAMDTQKLKFTTTKTASSERTIKIPLRVMADLKKLKRRVAENKMAWGSEYDAKGMNLVFCRAKGEPFPKSTLFNVFRRMQTKTGINAGILDGKEIFYSIHATRHTHTSFCVEAGMTPKAIQRRLGHGSYEITMNIYAHVSKQFEISSADLYEEATEELFKALDQQTENVVNFDLIRGQK